MLHGESHQARSIDTLWWVMFGVACAGFALVGFLLLLGWWRRNRRELPGGGDERVATWLVVGPRRRRSSEGELPAGREEPAGQEAGGEELRPRGDPARAMPAAPAVEH